MQKSLLLSAPHIIDLPLKMANGRLSQFLGIKYYTDYNFENVVEFEAHLVLECPLYNYIRDNIRFTSLL